MKSMDGKILKRGRFFVFSFLLFVVVTHSAFAQSPQQPPPMQLFLDMLCFESDSAGKTAANIYLQIPYSEVTFIKKDNRYIASLDVILSLKDSVKQVWSLTRRISLEAENFSETVSTRRTAVQQFSKDIDPGSYNLEISVIDNESKKTVKMDRPVSVPNFFLPTFSLSNIMLVSKALQENGRINIIPNFSGRFLQDEQNLTVFFEVYSKIQLDSILLTATFFNEKDQKILQFTRTQELQGSRTQVIWGMDGSNLSTNRVKLTIEAVGLGKDSLALPKAASSRIIYVQLRGLPATITDINKAIEQLRYIAKPSEIDKMRNAPTEEEKRKLFLEFWKKLDPDPNTPRNELMEEYYDRVAYANQNFTRFMEGWQSDMGMVYIQYGPPENIERHPFESDSKPYEIWYYYKLNREFVFVDETGFGDYRLQYPLLDLWGRIR